MINEAHIPVAQDYKITGVDMSKLDAQIKELKSQHPEIKKYNSCILVSEYYSKIQNVIYKETYNIYLFQSNENTRVNANITDMYSDAVVKIDRFSIENKEANGILKLRFFMDGAGRVLKNVETSFQSSGTSFSETITTDAEKIILPLSSLGLANESRYVGYYPNHGKMKAYVKLLKRYFNLENLPDVSDSSGQLGGGGLPLQDIKVQLYVNKVTRGSVTLKKPQLEISEKPSDWRPNPYDNGSGAKITNLKIGGFNYVQNSFRGFVVKAK